jgi:PAS domain-containing protein
MNKPTFPELVKNLFVVPNIEEFNNNTEKRRLLVRALNNILNNSDGADRQKKYIFANKKEVEFQQPIFLATNTQFTEQQLAAAHAILGIYSETGEQVQALFNFILTGTYNPVNTLEEGGDIEFYNEAYFQAFGHTREEAHEHIIDKLLKRHESGTFSVEGQNERNDKNDNHVVIIAYHELGEPFRYYRCDGFNIDTNPLEYDGIQGSDNSDKSNFIDLVLFGNDPDNLDVILPGLTTNEMHQLMKSGAFLINIYE